MARVKTFGEAAVLFQQDGDPGPHSPKHSRSALAAAHPCLGEVNVVALISIVEAVDVAMQTILEKRSYAKPRTSMTTQKSVFADEWTKMSTNTMSVTRSLNVSTLSLSTGVALLKIFDSIENPDYYQIHVPN